MAQGLKKALSLSSCFSTIFIIKDFLYNVLRALLSFLCGGRKCLSCAAPTFQRLICSDCEKRFYTFSNLKRIKRKNILLLDTLYSISPYLAYDKVVFIAWKEGGERALTDFYCKRLDIALKILFIEYGNIALTVVPPRKGKIRLTGYDQMDDIKTHLHYRYGYEFSTFLTRLTKKEQKSLSGSERLQTIGRAFTVNYAVKKGVKTLPPVICILDDLVTTGSTLESCAMALKNYGVKKVIALTIYHAVG